MGQQSRERYALQLRGFEHVFKLCAQRERDKQEQNHFRRVDV